MRDEILVRLSRADAEQSRETVAFLATLGAKYQQEDQVRPLLDALDAALAAPAEGPERAATGETLDELIAECEARFLEWRLDGTWIEDGPGSAHWESAAAVRAHGWEDDPPDDADEDGWYGLSDDSIDADLADLLRLAMQRAAGEGSEA